MKKVSLLLVMFFIAFGFLNAQDCSNLFFSEYVEGSSQNKALEVYNPTNDTIYLNNYVIKRYKNGLSAPDTQLPLYWPDSGIVKIAPHDVLVVSNGQLIQNTYGAVSQGLWDVADLHGTGDHATCPMYFNGNDALTLENTITGVGYDLFGKIGIGAEIETAQGWSNITDTTITYNNNGVPTEVTIHDYIVPAAIYWMAWTSDHSLIRKPTVKQGVKENPDVFSVSMEWDTLTGGSDIWTDLGYHTCDCGGTNVTPLESHEQVYFFPNPVINDHFLVKASRVIKEVEVYNISGQMVYSAVNSPVYGEKLVTLNNPQKGIYVVKVIFDNNNYEVRKIVVH